MVYLQTVENVITSDFSSSALYLSTQIGVLGTFFHEV